MTSLEIPKEKSGLLHILIVILLGLIVYSNTFKSPFVFDDPPSITDNPFIKSFEYFTNPILVEKISTIPELRYMFKNRIVGYFTFALNYKANSLNVFGYHLVNLLLHIANALLVYQLVILTFTTPYFKPRQDEKWNHYSPRSIAFFSALLFVCHPIQTQAVTYIVQRFTSLATFFYLLSVVLYLKARTQVKTENFPKSAGEHRSRMFLYLMSVLSAVLAMKTKEIAFTLPVMIALYEFMFFDGKLLKRMLYLTPLLLTILIIPMSLSGDDFSIAEISGGLNKAMEVSSQKSVSRWDYLFTQFRVIVTYIRLLFLPVGQNIDYDYPIYQSFFKPQVFSSFVFLLSAFMLGVYLYFRSGRTDGGERRLFRVVSFGIFWFFITLSVESSFLPIADVIFEHRVYLPSVGFFLGATAACFFLLGKQQTRVSRITKPAAAVGTALILILSTAAYARNAAWEDSIKLWQDAAEKSPYRPRPHNILAIEYRNRGMLDEAIREYRTLVKLKPDGVEFFNNLCAAYSNQEKITEAARECKRALELQPGFAPAHSNLCMVYAKQRKFNLAIEECRTALRLQPGLANAKNNLQIIYNSMSEKKL